MPAGCAMRTASELNELSHAIIGAAIEVHRRVGPGCLESAYTPCLALEFARRRLDFRREVALTLRYDELVIPRAYFADFIVQECIVIEV
jgi:GxxExxY protein